jgi:hypothetical protein
MKLAALALILCTPAPATCSHMAEYIPTICVFRTKFGLTDATMPTGGTTATGQLQVDEYWKDAIYNARLQGLCVGAETQINDFKCLLRHFKWQPVSCAKADNVAQRAERLIRQGTGVASIVAEQSSASQTALRTLAPTAMPTPPYDTPDGWNNWDAFLADPLNGGTWAPTQYPTPTPTLDPTWSPTAPTPYRPDKGYLSEYYGDGDSQESG